MQYCRQIISRQCSLKEEVSVSELTFALRTSAYCLLEMFPSIKNPEVESTRLKNVGRQAYICVTSDDQGNYVLRTTTRKLESISSPERKYLQLNQTRLRKFLFFHQVFNKNT